MPVYMQLSLCAVSRKISFIGVAENKCHAGHAGYIILLMRNI